MKRYKDNNVEAEVKSTDNINTNNENVEDENIDIITVKNKRKKKHKKRKKIKSYVGRVLEHRKRVPIPLLVLSLLGAFALDFIRIIKNFLIGIFVVLIIAGVVGGLFAWSKIEPYYTEYKEFADKQVENSSVETFRTQEATYIYDSKGNLLIKLRGDQDSDYLEYEQIPTYAIDAFVAVEDRTFWSNPGIDVKGIIRVLRDAVQTRGDELHGASTITQQLARNIFLTHEVSLERKGKEMMLAIDLTQKYTKREIMEFYINDICYANALYGLEAASKAYFNKSSSELSLSQIAYICAIPNSPEYYNPYKYPERALERRDKILDDMLELDLIDKSEYNQAINEVITIEKPNYKFNDYQSTYAIECATKYLMKQDGFEFRYTFENMTDYNNYKKDYNDAFDNAKYKLTTGGYKIYTSLDSTIQNNMQDILNEQLSFDEEINEATGIYALQGAITVFDNYSGKIIAVVGGRGQENNTEVYSLNRAYQSTRQPGSSIKPLVVYTPALENGYTPNTTVFNIDVTKAKEKGVDVQSLGGTAMSLRSALEQSKNGVAWQIFDKLGAKTALSYVNNMKFESICPDDYFNSASLGGLTYGVTTVEMAGAYATLENHGMYREPNCIISIIDNQGNDIYRDEPEIEIYNAKAADTMVDMMTGVLTNGTAAKLNWYKSTDVVAACKTGTTNDSKDGWLCGFTPYFTVTVWVGYDQPRTLNNLYGATYPGQIWKECMLSLIENYDTIGEFDKTEEYYEMTPSTGDEEFLPGRSDDEMLSEGYYVADYRSDREIGKGVESVIQQMYTRDKSNENYPIVMQQLYDEGQGIINTIYSRNYRAELQEKLDWTYLNLLQEAGY